MTAAHVPTRRHDGRSRTVRRLWRTDPLSAYRLVSDPVATAAHSDEVLDVAWEVRADAEAPSVGDRFHAHNRIGSVRWTSTSTVVCAEPGRRFAFAVGDVQRPTAVWSFDLSAAAPGWLTRVEYAVVLGSGASMLDAVGHLGAEQYDAVVDGRLDGLRTSMSAVLDALGAAARSQQPTRAS